MCCMSLGMLASANRMVYVLEKTTKNTICWIEITLGFVSMAKITTIAQGFNEFGASCLLVHFLEMSFKRQLAVGL